MAKIVDHYRIKIYLKDNNDHHIVELEAHDYKLTNSEKILRVELKVDGIIRLNYYNMDNIVGFNVKVINTNDK